MEKKYKILIISQYFWPENFRINDLAENWIKKGYEVEILTAKPNFPSGKLFEIYKNNPNKYSEFYGAKIYRMPIFYRGSGTRIEIALNYISFLISSLVFSIFKLRKKKYDIIFTFGISPITVAIVSNFLSWMIGSKTVLWVLDLWPDILKEIGVVKNKRLYSLLKKLVKKIYTNSDIIYAQSSSMRDEINYIIKNNRTKLLSSWPEKIDYLDQSVTTKISTNKNDLNLMFTGTIGEYQNLEEIIKVLKELENEEVKLFIVGGGRHKSLIKKYMNQLNIKNVELINSQPLKEIPSFVNVADVLVVSLQSGKVGSLTIPGKVQTYMNFKKPILAHISGETQKLIEKFNIGLTSAPGDIEKLKKNINYLIKLKKSNQLNHEFNLSKNNLIFKIDNAIKVLEEDFYKISDTHPIKLISSIDKIPFKENFVLSGLNLAFLGYLFNKEIDLYHELYNWPDGIFSRISNSKINKIPGKKLLLNLKLPNNVNRIHVIGNLSENGKKFLQNHFRKTIYHHKLPFAEISKLKECLLIMNFKKNDVILLTLPTPKQEQLAKYISENIDYYKIFCIGGAINMLCGDETPVPKILEKNFEFLWRLRFDTKRRFKRLIKSFLIFFIKGILFSRVKNLIFKIN